MKTMYRAESLEELAAFLEQMAEDLPEKKLKRDRAHIAGWGEGLRQAADIVRRTTIEE